MNELTKLDDNFIKSAFKTFEETGSFPVGVSKNHYTRLSYQYQDMNSEISKEGFSRFINNLMVILPMRQVGQIDIEFIIGEYFAILRKQNAILMPAVYRAILTNCVFFPTPKEILDEFQNQQSIRNQIAYKMRQKNETKQNL